MQARPPKLFETPRRSSSGSAHQTISTRAWPSSPWGRAFISTIRITPIMIRRVMLGSKASRTSQTKAAR